MSNDDERDHAEEQFNRALMREDTDPPKGTYRYIVTVNAATERQADTVMAERLGYDDDYGFPYTIEGWDDAS